jgi:hypothetical protein
VAARRLLIVMLVLLGVSTVAAALVPVDRDALRDESTTTSTRADKRTPTGALVEASIGAGAPKLKAVRMQVGDQLQLRVTSPQAHEVEIPALDELEDVDPDAPATFDLLLFDEGTYNVRLVESGRRIGRIVVERQKSAPSPSKTSGQPRRERAPAR